MAEMLLTIHTQGRAISPPVLDGVQIEWEKTGVPGRLTFTTVKIFDDNMSFNEGDQVQFSYDGKLVFVGYVFSKSRNKDHHIKVTCYDQLRYFKNKFSYVFENKRGDEIISALCKDFNLNTGILENTKYVIPAIAEENSTAFDIVLKVLEDTLVNTGEMYVLYDNAGKLTLRNSAHMLFPTIIDGTTARDFDYSTSIDEETYNSIILYYKDEDNTLIPYTAFNSAKINEWGLLRYFEEVKTQTIAQNKANKLLELYCRKTRQLQIKDAFGSVEVRAGGLIPVRLYLGDAAANNYMLVQKVVHKFKDDEYTMDLTLESAWDSEIITSDAKETRTLTVNAKTNYGASPGLICIMYTDANNERAVISGKQSSFTVECYRGTSVSVLITPAWENSAYKVTSMSGRWSNEGDTYKCTIYDDSSIDLTWTKALHL